MGARPGADREGAARRGHRLPDHLRRRLPAQRRGAAAHARLGPSRSRPRCRHRRAPAADLSLDLRRRVRRGRPPRGEPRARQLGRHRRPPGRPRPGPRLRRQSRVEIQPLVSRVARARSSLRRLLPRAGPRLRHVSGGPPEGHPAPARVRAPRRHARTRLDHVRPRPGRHRSEHARRADRSDRRAARLPGAWCDNRASGRDRLPVEGVGNDLHPPPADPRHHPDLAPAGGRPGAGDAAADRDQRPARR